MLNPTRYLHELRGRTYKCRTIRCNDYVHLFDDLVEKSNARAVLGVYDGYTFDDADVVDGRNAALRKIENSNIGSRIGTSSLLMKNHDSMDYIRQVWSESQGAILDELTVSDYTLLCTFLELCETYGRITDDFFLPDDVVSALCKQYGLPLFQSNVRIEPENDLRYSTYFSNGQLIVDPTLENSLYYGFHTRIFSIRMKKLYCLYLSWLYLYWDEKDAAIVLNSVDYQNPDTYFEGISLQSSVIEPAALRNAIVYHHRNEMVTTKSICFDKFGKGNYIETAENLLSMLTLQMLDLLIAGESALDGMSIYTCDECGASFLRKHRNARLCENCRTNAAKLKKHRAKQKHKKEGQKDGEETRK